MEKIKIRQSVVVEGRDDEAAVRLALDCDIICTHGYGISAETLALIKTAYENNGIIIFTDPDHAGLAIRNRLKKLFPDAQDAFLSRDQALKKGDIGIENARPGDIARAVLAVANVKQESGYESLSESDMARLGLSGSPDSAERRAKLGAALGIGYANSKSFLKRLNYMNISPETISETLAGITKDLKEIKTE